MSEVKKTVFEQLQDSLITIIEELTSANDALYVVATTTMDLSDKLDVLNSKLDALLEAAGKTVPIQPATPATKKSPASTFTFKGLKKEMK